MSEGRDNPHSGWRRLGTSAAWLVGGRVVSAACGLVLVPIALASLGTARFGVWIALTGLLWTFSNFDGGIGLALQNRVAALVAGQRHAEAAGLVRRGRRWLWWLALGAGALGAALIAWGRWDRWLGVDDGALAAELTPALVVAFAGAALNLPLSLAPRVAAAVEQMWLTGLWTAIASVLGVAAAAVAASLQLGLATFVGVTAFTLLAPHAGTWVHLCREAKWLRVRSPPEPDVSGLARTSLWFFLPQVGAAFAGTFVPTLVAFFAGPAAAGTFGVLQRLFGFAAQLQIMVLMPTWPAYTQAAARGDAGFLQRTFRASWRLTVIGFIAPTLLFAPWVPTVVQGWLGARAPEIPGVLLWTLAGWQVLQYCGQPIAMLLNGVGRMQSMAVLGWIGIGVTLALCPWLGPQWGAAGVVVALIVPYLLFNLPVTFWYARRALGDAAFRSPTAAAVPVT